MRRASFRVNKLSLSTFYHSTEDPERVKQALMNLLPKSVRDSIHLEETKAKGHYGNSIGILRIELSSELAQKALKNILCSLTDIDCKILLATLGNRVGPKPSHFYLRLSKQDAYLGKLTLLDSDDVIKVSATISGVRKLKELESFISQLISDCRR